MARINLIGLFSAIGFLGAISSGALSLVAGQTDTVLID
jgi:hypothetical protein